MGRIPPMLSHAPVHHRRAFTDQTNMFTSKHSRRTFTDRTKLFMSKPGSLVRISRMARLLSLPDTSLSLMSSICNETGHSLTRQKAVHEPRLDVINLQ